MLYDTVQFLHVAGAIIWVGSGVGLSILMVVMARAGDGVTLAGASRHMEMLGSRLFGPAAMSTLLFGVIAVLVGPDIGFSETWIVIGFAGVAVSLLFVVISNPINQKIGKTVEEKGADAPELAGLRRRITVLNFIDLVVLFVVVWAMVAKPGAVTVA